MTPPDASDAPSECEECGALNPKIYCEDCDGCELCCECGEEIDRLNRMEMV